MPPRKREPATLWKLVDARCLQLADAVASARTAFLVALTWSFVWAWALYSVDLGYLRKVVHDSREMHALSLVDNKNEAFVKWCERFPTSVKDTNIPSELRLQLCAKSTKERYEWAEKAYLESTLVSFPGGFGKLSVADLGVIGEAGLLLIMSWAFFTARRENHSVRAIVDMDDVSRRRYYWCPRVFKLEPQDGHLSAEHYAYAYHTVAQRFVLLFSRHSQPLLLFTVLICLVPAGVASWNLGTDIRDAHKLKEAILYRRIEFSTALLAFIYYLTGLVIWFQVRTSVVLNAWYLAVRDVWMEEWDERTADSASVVKIDVLKQTAKKVRQQNRRSRR
ncbi:MAG: hypothetical protein HY659_03575 [Rhizobiales bacterium]|nr:hypothetical protein [Hyphomicrobiales bacterium]